MASLMLCIDAFTRPVTPVSLLIVQGAKKEIRNPIRIQQQFAKLVNDDDEEVRVDLIPDVDAFSLTAVGFGLIAFNFLLLANVSFVLYC